MNTFLLSYSEEEYILPFFKYIQDSNFYIIILIGEHKIVYNKDGEYLNIDDVNNIICDGDVVIRWGSRIPIKHNCITYNIGKCIHNASSKKLARELMERNNIHTIETLLSIEDLPIMTYPVIIRPLMHEKGSDFFVCNDIESARHILQEKFNNNLSECYVSSYFDRTNEYRVYCAHGKILYVQEKTGTSKIDISKDNIKLINELPWETINWEALSSKSMFHNMLNESLKATNDVLKLDFSAVDILYNSKNDSFAICEINTMPELLDYGFIRFSQYFKLLRNYSEKYSKRLKHIKIDEEDLLWRKNLNLDYILEEEKTQTST